VNARELRLFRDLVGALTERFSGAGHIMQQIDWEHRGHCPPGECSMRCTTYTRLLLDACDVLEAEVDRPAQAGLGLFGEDVAG
jgi:hypothetical protein